LGKTYTLRPYFLTDWYWYCICKQNIWSLTAWSSLWLIPREMQSD
jgi:hypothetical protein